MARSFLALWVKPAHWRPALQRVMLHRAAKPLLWAVGLSPALWLLARGLMDALGANPVEHLIRGLGEWSLRWLWLCLAITPLREATGLVALARFRRMLGLLAAGYASLHLLAYAGLELGLDWGELWRDTLKRPFIFVGMLAWALMLPLAFTSMDRVVKAMGALAWKRLHRLVYLVALAALLHFVWMRAGKLRFGEPSLYGGLLALLLGWRVARAWKGRRPAR